MNKKIVFVIGFLILLIPALLFLLPSKPLTQQKPAEVGSTPVDPEIIVDYPKPNDIVTSPLIVKGRARGTWYFEGQFPITLYYGVQNSFVNVNSFALGEWMTEDYVDFEVVINFPVPTENEGLLVLSKNNPSDLEENNASLRIPLRFHEKTK